MKDEVERRRAEGGRRKEHKTASVPSRRSSFILHPFLQSLIPNP